MSRIRCGLVVALALAVSGGGHFLSAQRGWGGSGLGLNGVGPRLGENITLALENQSQLQLSQEQVDALGLLREGINMDVAPLEAEIDGLRASILAGDVNSVEGLSLLQELYTQYDVVAEPYRIEVTNILTPAQHESLQAIMWQTRPYGGRGLGLYGAGVVGTGQPLGLGRGIGLGRGVGLGRGAGLAYGRGVGLGYGRGVGLGYGRGIGLGYGRGVGRGLGRGAGRGLGLRWR